MDPHPARPVWVVSATLFHFSEDPGSSAPDKAGGRLYEELWGLHNGLALRMKLTVVRRNGPTTPLAARLHVRMPLVPKRRQSTQGVVLGKGCAPCGGKRFFAAAPKEIFVAPKPAHLWRCSFSWVMT